MDDHTAGIARPTRRAFGAAAAAVALGLPAIARAQAATLTVWHDLGDNGIAWFDRVGQEFARQRPGVTLRSQSFPTDQWFGRVIGAINTGSAPDLIFNNYERVIRVQNQTSRVMDMRPVLDGVQDRDFLSAEDLRVGTFRDRMIIIPIQRVQMALGTRKSWLEKVGEPVPVTWDDTKRVAQKFREADPDGNGRADTFGFALQAARPRDLITCWTCSSSAPACRTPCSTRRGTSRSTSRSTPPCWPSSCAPTRPTVRAAGHDQPLLAEMYQVIEGGRGGCSVSATGTCGAGTRPTPSAATSCRTPGRNSSLAATPPW
jgi:hypothetical protein